MRKRTIARERAMQVLYQYFFDNYSPTVSDYIFEEYGEREIKEITEFCNQIVTGVIQNKKILEELINITISISMTSDMMILIDKVLLSMGIFEIVMIKEIEKAVTINEIILLAKRFSEQNNYKLINAVLEKFDKTGDLIIVYDNLKNIYNRGNIKS